MEQSDKFLTDVGKFADLVMQAGEHNTWSSAATKGEKIVEHFNTRRRQYFELPKYGVQHVPDQGPMKIPVVPALSLLGAGQYAAVLTHPFYADRVIKIGLNKNGGLDDPWLNYATMSMQLPDNPYSLRVYSIRLFDTTYVAEVERLEPLDRDPDRSTYAIMWTEALTAVVYDDKYSWPEMVSDLSAYEEFNAANFMYYARLFKKIGNPSDLHNENIMARSDGTVVVTDPYHKQGAIRYKVSTSNYALKDEYGVSVVHAERMSNGSKRLRGVRYQKPVNDWRAQQKTYALWPDTLDAVQPHQHALSGILSQVRPELLPQGSDLVERLRAA